MRRVSTLVLPEPAPAMTRTGPDPCVTASTWTGFRPSSSGSAAPDEDSCATRPPYRRLATGTGCPGRLSVERQDPDRRWVQEPHLRCAELLAADPRRHVDLVAVDLVEAAGGDIPR